MRGHNSVLAAYCFGLFRTNDFSRCCISAATITGRNAVATIKRPYNNDRPDDPQLDSVRGKQLRRESLTRICERIKVCLHKLKIFYHSWKFDFGLQSCGADHAADINADSSRQASRASPDVRPGRRRLKLWGSTPKGRYWNCGWFG